MLQNGNKIKEIRETRKSKGEKITQNDMADHLGVTQSTYSKIENGYIPTNLDTISKIAEKLKTETKNLISDDSKKAIFAPLFQDSSVNNGDFNYNSSKINQLVDTLELLIEEIKKQGK